eukprot:849006-Prorocentrum_minimum.AAC.1
MTRAARSFLRFVCKSLANEWIHSRVVCDLHCTHFSRSQDLRKRGSLVQLSISHPGVATAVIKRVLYQSLCVGGAGDGGADGAAGVRAGGDRRSGGGRRGEGLQRRVLRRGEGGDKSGGGARPAGAMRLAPPPESSARGSRVCGGKHYLALYINLSQI